MSGINPLPLGSYFTRRGYRIPGGPASRPELVMKGDFLMASAKQPNDQNDPISACDSVALCSDNERLPVSSVLENLEPTSSSLIDNWIDA
jgi:hypothetical protein